MNNVVSLGLAACLLLSACAPAVTTPTTAQAPPAAAAATQQAMAVAEKLATSVVAKDSDATTITFLGIQERHGPDAYGIPVNTYRLFSFLARAGGSWKHQLVVTDTYLAKAYREWNAARDEAQGEMSFTPISRQVSDCHGDSGCVRTETFSVDIPDSALRERRERGLAISGTAKSGEARLFQLTPQQIAGQLEALDGRRDTILAAKGKPAAEPVAAVPAPPEVLPKAVIKAAARQGKPLIPAAGSKASKATRQAKAPTKAAKVSAKAAKQAKAKAAKQAKAKAAPAKAAHKPAG